MMALSISHPRRLFIQPLVADSRAVLSIRFKRLAHAGVSTQDLEAAEALWERLDLKGAAFISDGGIVLSEDIPVVHLSSHALALGILARTRGPLFMARLPFDPRPENIGRDVTTTDPQLIRLARYVDGGGE